MTRLRGKTILLTSGPTSAPLDAVRVITNRSSGRLGSTVAFALLRAGARVIQLAGEGSVSACDLSPEPPGPDLKVIRFETVPELKTVLQELLARQPVDAVIMAAAVLDYIPVEAETGKKRSGDEEWVIRLRRGEKLIEQIRHWSPDTVIVGFKLETGLSLEALAERAQDLMDRSGARAVVANRVEEVGAGGHTAFLIERGSGGHVAVSPALPSREAIAEALVSGLERWLAEKGGLGL